MSPIKILFYSAYS